MILPEATLLSSEGDWSHPFDTDGDASTLEIEDKRYKLDDPKEAQKALDHARERRQQLRDGELDEYEGKGTDYGQGGRTRLLYDELVAEMAVDKHKGKHSLSWEKVCAEADRIRKIRAIQTRGN